MKKARLVLSVLCLSLFAGAVPRVVTAQNAAPNAGSTSFRGTSAAPVVVAAREATFTAATIQGVVSTNPSGKLRVLHVLLTGPQGMVDANLGPYVNDEVKRSLVAGQHVEVTGVAQSLNGRNCLLVRDLTVGGQHVTLRNEKGFLIHPQKAGITRIRVRVDAATGANQ